MGERTPQLAEDDPARPVVRGEPLAELELTAGGLWQDAADKLAAVTARAAGARTATIHLAAGATLYVAGGSGLPEGLQAIRRAPARSTLAGWVIGHGHPLIVNDVRSDRRVPPDAPVRRVGIRAYAGFPIRDPAGEIVGVCAVMDGEPRSWSAAQLAGVDEGAQACTAFVAEQQARVAEQQARREAERQRRFLDTVLEHLPSGVAACDAEGRLAFANQAIRELAGGLPDDPDLRAWPGTTDPDRPAHTAAADAVPLLRALAGEHLRGIEVTVPRPARHPRIVLVDAQPITGADGDRLGAVVAVHDVTERRRTERFRQAQLGVAEALSPTDTVERAGATVLRALGTALGWSHAELWLVDTDADLLTVAARYAAPGVLVDGPAQLRRGTGLAGTAWDSGSAVWTDDPDPAAAPADPARPAGGTGVAVPVPSGGQVLAVLTGFADTVQDPTDAVAVLLSGIAGHLGQFLERRRAEELTLALARSKDEYLALVGHELRTPLTTISAYIDLLRDVDAAGFAADGRDMLDAMARNSAALREIVDELLDLAALDSGHATVAADPVDLTACVRAALDEMTAGTAGTGVSVEADLAPAVVVTGDERRLRQVLTALLDNAVRHSVAGGRITVTLTRPNPAVAELTVTDTGVGIPHAEHRQIFTRFYRSTRTRDLRIPGAGLGLALSRAIVERHHGSIHHVPAPAAGTRMVVRLPVRNG
ncbi:GAF domain-containing protein [Dactylosporangium aurantiacum]|uniref:histidine kinase n=1 Tax=Dactylosporangium aurantiacum TaxID=35754 RepID=A0A9Q9IM14_9ACTN|nr:ATP-binding protein [Dactylosporangium aurantiacum]MDG6105776.1 ATP-binding protein [Dactylosporangium aurantiacum]UWZ58036.1 GAF domain-containing protein [Dactylosporangium aurantiacum]